MSMDVSNVDTEPMTHCTPKVELYIKGAFVDPTRHVRGGWIDLLVDCQGVLWMSNLVAIWRYSLEFECDTLHFSKVGLYAAV